MEEPRPSIDDYKMALAVEVASRSNCLKIHVGAILLMADRIRAVGYNGTIAGYDDCFEGGCERCRDENITGGDQLDRCVCVHAEENALASAARYGIPVEGTECYVTHEPCIGCTKLLIQAGIKTVVYLNEYVYESDTGIDRNKSRKQMRDHSMARAKDEREGTSFRQFKAETERSRKAAETWIARLAEMKNLARDHCAAKGQLIRRQVRTQTV